MRTGRLLLVAVVIVAALLGVGYGWKTATIIADTTPPEILQSFTTHGDIAYPADGRLTVNCYVEEAVGMQGVTCELFSGLPPTGTRLEKITLELVERGFTASLGHGGGGGGGDRTLYHYRGTFTRTLTREKSYILRYWATDEAGHKSDWQTSVRLLNLDGYVKVNGIRVEGPDDSIVVKSLDLTIQVYVTAGADTVQNIYMVINGDQSNIADFTRKGNALTGYYWETTYTLPQDGRYSFTVQVLDTAGNDVQLASFTITMRNQNRWLMVGGAVAVLGLVAVYGYYGRKGRKR